MKHPACYGYDHKILNRIPIISMIFSMPNSYCHSKNTDSHSHSPLPLVLITLLTDDLETSFHTYTELEILSLDPQQHCSLELCPTTYSCHSTDGVSDSLWYDVALSPCPSFLVAWLCSKGESPPPLHGSLLATTCWTVAVEMMTMHVTSVTPQLV